MQNEICKVVEEFARTVRVNYAVGVPFYKDIDYLIEKLGGNIESTNIEDGLEDSKLCLRTAIWEPKFTIKVKFSVTQEKRNYEIAKQIGHLFLHTTYLDTLVDNEKALLVKDDLSDVENKAQANIFADTLIMPQKEFTKEVKKNIEEDGRVNMKNVAEKFGVTCDRALVRASRLNLIEW